MNIGPARFRVLIRPSIAAMPWASTIRDGRGGNAMATFEKREKAQEATWVHDQETTFKIGVRRNKLLGLWAAELMGVSGAAAEAYAKEVVESDFKDPGEEDVLEKVMADLKDKGVDISEHRVRKEMSDLLEVAREQIVGD